MTEVPTYTAQIYIGGDPAQAKAICQSYCLERCSGLCVTVEPAREHVAALVRAIGDVASLAAEVADGGDVFPAGIRDLARRLVEDLEARGQNIEAISARSPT